MLFGILLFPYAAELLLELFDAARGVHEALFARVCRVRVSGNVAGYHEVVHAVDLLDLLALHCRAGHEAGSGRNVYEAYGVEIGMNLVFHSLLAPNVITPVSL